MEVLKRLLGLEFIGWVLIALAAFGFSELTFKWGVLFILFSKICCALKFSCKWCSCGKGSKDCELPVPSKRKKK
tara:strand:- start:236 stop:457 length:222 start_codon:yes stop_codon:yes gene_type:complete